MESRFICLGKSCFAVLIAVVMAVSLMPPLENRAYADDGSLVAAQGFVATASSEDSLEAADESELQPEAVYSGVGIAKRGKVQGHNWTSWSFVGNEIGDAAGMGLNAFQLKLTGLKGISGGIRYRAYKRGSGWKPEAANGKSTGATRNVEAVRVRLVGEVSQHYDVLYRVYVSGRGWQPWVKNNAKAGVTGKKVRVNAIQVKLSPRTEEAAGKPLNRVGVRYEGRIAKSGWQDWKGDGKIAGTVGKSKVLNAFAVQVDAGRYSGWVRYRAHDAKAGWQDIKTSGAAGASRGLDAIRIKLAGKIAKLYDVYYQVHVANFGWLDWAKNGAVAGSVGYGLQLEALRVKLVTKGAAAPGETDYPTVNLMERGQVLNGIDIASWQAGIKIAEVNADFVIVKSTQGNWYTNPYFREHADATLASKKLLGIYHYADLRGSATAQATYFVNAVKPYLGKAMLFLDYEAEILDIANTEAWAKKFMDTVYKKTGVKPLIYLSKNQTRYHNWSSVAKKYGLWVAQYPNYNAVNGFLASPWTDDYGYGAWSSPRLFQYTSQGYGIGGYGSALDFDKFYGSVLTWRRLASKS